MLLSKLSTSPYHNYVLSTSGMRSLPIIPRRRAFITIRSNSNIDLLYQQQLKSLEKTWWNTKRNRIHDCNGCDQLKRFFQNRSHVDSSSSSMPNTKNDDKKDIQISTLENGILKLSFNRVQKANAMGKSMLSQLQDIIQDLNNEEKSRSIRCVILTSCSDKVFSAGADLKERATMTMEEAATFVTSLRAALNDLSELPMPMIACVEVRLYYFSQLKK